MYWLVDTNLFSHFLEGVLEVLCERKVPLIFSAGDETIAVHHSSWKICDWTKNMDLWCDTIA